MTNKNNKKTNIIGIFVLIGIFVIITIAIMIFFSSLNSNNSGSNTNNTIGVTSNNLPNPGQNAIVTDGNKNGATFTKSDFTELSNFIGEHNVSAVQNMINDGQVVIIPTGTQVEVLSVNGISDWAKVQITTGDLQGQTVYIFWDALNTN